MRVCNLNVLKKYYNFLLSVFFALFLISGTLTGERVKNNTDNASEISETSYSKLPVGKDGKPKRLTMEETIHLVLENNTMARVQRLEILKSDTELLKDESKYAPILGMGYQGSEKKDKQLPSTAFSGTKTNIDRYYANISKLFSSGTYFQVEVSDTRYDSNAGESLTAQMSSSFASSLAQPPLHTGALTVALRQELLKNTFGYNQRRMNEVARNNSLIKRQEVTYQLSQLVVQAMIDYWLLAIAEENMKTSQVLLDNSKNIRNITIRKQGIGLAEAFEINQWDAIVANSESRKSSAILDRDSKKRNLLRTLNLAPSTEISGETELIETIPKDIDLQKDIKVALETRPEYKNLKLQKENAEKIHELAKNNLLPSVSVAGKYSSRGYGRHANTAYNEVPDRVYPESSVEFKVEYPLGDEGAKADSRNAEIVLRQISIQENEMRRRIEDDVRESMDRISSSHLALVKSKEALTHTENFYKGLLMRYTQGRFTAETVKNALDALVQARLGYMQAKINFNISLVRYDLARNKIFEKNHVDMDKVLDKMN